jgi:chitin synthase
VLLDSEGTSDNRDDLAKNLYLLLFSWPNEYINKRLSCDVYSTFIGLLNLAGFPNITSPSRLNFVDQFCVNYTNERLQNQIQIRTTDLQTGVVSPLTSRG